MAVLVAAASVAVFGIGSAASAKSPSNAGHAAKKSTIIIGTEAPVNTSTVSWPGIFSALQVGAKAVNKHGGINGHPIKIWTCNNNYAPSQTVACAREAVAAGVEVMVGDLNPFDGPTYAAILAKAGIADVENTGPLPNGFDGPLTFPLTFPQSTFLACDSRKLAQAAGGNKIVFVTNVPAAISGLLSPLYAAGAKETGDDYLPVINAPGTTSDYSPYVADAAKEGANIVIMGLVSG